MNHNLTILKERTSVRRFKPDPVPPELLRQLIEAATWAPSAGNLQPWFFYIVTDQHRKRCLSDAALQQNFVAEAPACIVVCAEPARSERTYGERGRVFYCLQDTAAATQNILLASTALGLGSCWVGAFDADKVRACLHIPDRYVPIALVPVGYPLGEPHKTQRRPPAEVAKYL